MRTAAVRLRSLAILALCLAPALSRAYVTVSSSQILGLADDGVADGTGFWATILTPPYPGGNNLLYGPDALTATGTSRLVFDLNGSPVDMQADEPVAIPVTTATGPGPNGLGDSITMARDFGSLEYGARYTIVVNPHSGTGEDTVQIQAWVTDSPAGLPASVGLRMVLDTMVGGNDGSPLSIDDGASIISVNTLDQAVTEGVPSDWWSYDKVPAPTLSAQGVAWGNQYGSAATLPDAVEFCQWPDIASPGYWATDPNPGLSFSNSIYVDPPEPSTGDTAVVLWYTNTGQAGYIDGNNVAQGDGYTVAPGQTLMFTTYVGLNESPFAASPTPTLSWTPSSTPTWSLTSTLTASPSHSPTSTASPTFSASPTATPSFSASPSFTASPSFSASPTATPSFSASPSFTVSPSFSASPTVTLTPSISPTFSASPSFTASPTLSDTPSVSPTQSVSPTVTATGGGPTPVATATPAGSCLDLTPKYPNPDPSHGPVWLPYVLVCDAEVNIRIYDVAGETVRDLTPFAGQAGANEEYWDGLNSFGAPVASGVYIAHITAQSQGAEKGAWVKLAILR